MSSLCFLSTLLIVAHIAALEFRYHSNREIENFLLQVNASNPDITHLYSIGRSVRGQQLWVLALSVHPERHTVGVPEFKYVANMHGNEVNTFTWGSIYLGESGFSPVGGKTWLDSSLRGLGLPIRGGQIHSPRVEFKPGFASYQAGNASTKVLGRVLMLQLIDDLIRGYRNNETWSLLLLNSTRIHILPTMNPDGFDQSDTDCHYSQGRFNQNGVDLNRNFPDAFTHLRRKPPLDERKLEAEVQAVIGWLRNETFVLSANLHGGALVASYPYDNSNGGSEWVGGASVSPDNDVFVHLAKVYSYNHASMHRGEGCGGSRPFPLGITNGYQWYPLPGGMQDYNYVWAQCLELTLEVSCCKFPPVNDLPALWSANRPALLAFIRQVHLGVKGQVFDSSGVPVQNAVVEVKGRNNMSPFRSDKHGEYYRLLLPGNYSFTVTLPGHETLTQTISIPHSPDRYSAVKHDFRLQRVSATAPPDFAATTTGSLHLNGSSGAGPTWTGLGVGLVVALRSLID